MKRLDGNIGYIHLTRFVPPEVFNPAADQAMRSLSDTAALIIDMRENGGGHPASVAYLVSFFLDQGARVHINDLIWRNRRDVDVQNGIVLEFADASALRRQASLRSGRSEDLFGWRGIRI